MEKLNQLVEKKYFRIKRKEPKYLVNDTPGCITEVILDNSQYRRIDHQYGNDEYPKSLEKLEREIDNLIGIKEWIGGEEYRFSSYIAKD